MRNFAVAWSMSTTHHPPGATGKTPYPLEKGAGAWNSTLNWYLSNTSPFAELPHTPPRHSSDAVSSSRLDN